MHFVEAILFAFLIFVAPSILVIFIGWRLSRPIRNEYKRILVRSAILSFAVAPTVFGHAGPMPASWAIFLAPPQYKFTYGFLPIVGFWFAVGGIACALRWTKNRRRGRADSK